MRKVIISFIILSILIIYPGFPFSPKEESDKLSKRISLNFQNIDIIEALKYLAIKGGINIIPTRKVSGRVTLKVDNAPLKDIFDIMLRSNNLAYDKRGSIYNVMTEEEYKVLYGKSFSDTRKVKVFHLTYAIPEQIMKLCENMKSEIGKIFLDSESGSLVVIDTPQNIEEISKAIEDIESKKTVIKVFDLKYANAKVIADKLKEQITKKGIGFVQADEATNQVVVRTLPERIEEIEKIVKELDKKTKEVLIDAKIVKITFSRELTRGIEWEGLFDVARKYGLTYIGSYPFSSVSHTTTSSWRSRKQVWQDTGYVGSYPFSGTAFNYSNSGPVVGVEKLHVGVIGKHDVDALFKYLNTLGETKIVANPKLAVVNNQEARIHIGEKQAYITNTTTQTASTTTVAEEVTFVDTGIQLSVTPTINEEGFVTIKLKPEISSVASYLVTASNNKIPIITTSTAETTVIVKNATTIIIGGLKEEKEEKSSKEVPVLSKIPMIGAFFSSKTKAKTRSELLILVTPHIIKGDELTTGYQRDFGHRLDKEDQPYASFSPQKIEFECKPYQSYPRLDEKESFKLKPARVSYEEEPKG